jgi:hypothetical protein
MCLTTETRVAATDAPARRAFAAIKQRAERSTG